MIYGSDVAGTLPLLEGVKTNIPSTIVAFITLLGDGVASDSTLSYQSVDTEERRRFM